ncbi:hypothetical protein ASC80_01585 [Afipia sp. Root123D2]|uniref:hypothetical protein n=1 Tax=Afipia sp. Root123D2 TaxID=1736436 RepID=UPI0006F25BE5|nr:hypothetical protein [Afipia sp. Root123D2]KQW22114.1 hypothetical protein ASC80_01585 [Afipia sp. Root123D2]
MRNSYTAFEVAQKIGISLDTFYRTRERRHGEDGLPRPISERGPLRFECTGIDAWLMRHHPARPAARAANDTSLAPVLAAMTDAEHRDRLHRAYAPQTPPVPLDSSRRRARG